MTIAAEPSLPLPPDPLLTRVGANPEVIERARAVWRTVGQRCHDAVLELLPDGWTFDDKVVLDFGCGAGRTLHYFADEARRTKRFLGCDVHAASIEWLGANLCPPFAVFCNGPVPPLPLDDGSVDLIYAFSVFSHLTDTSSAWLLELRRVLRPGGIVIITFQGQGFWERRGDAHELPPLDTVGHTVWGHGRGFDGDTGPDSFMAGWWIREHWGRAFEIDRLEETGIPRPPIEELHGRGQGFVVMRSNGSPVTPDEIDAPNPDDPREVPGLLADRKLLLKELGHLRQQAIAAQTTLALTRSSWSWRLTVPLRGVRSAANRAVERLRRRRRGS